MLPKKFLILQILFELTTKSYFFEEDYQLSVLHEKDIDNDEYARAGGAATKK
jgi:hypothetical protein